MKKYVLRLMGILMVVMTVTIVWNYKFDTSGLLNRDFSEKRSVEPNQHFVKMRYILSTPQKYNAFCFGSSRVGNIDLEKISNGLKYYNMTYSQGIPAEWLDDLKMMIKHGVVIKQVMIGIDDFSFRVSPEIHKGQWLRIPYEDGKNMKTYFSYLMKRPRRPDTSAEKKGSIFDIYGTGRPLHPEPDELIEADIEKHLMDVRFLNPTHYEGNRIKETISELHQLKEICDEKGIELIVFINPINAVTYRDTNMQEFNEFKYQLAQIMDYYDFSGLNDITTNNYYYYETSHYRPLVGDMIINRIFHNGNDDFGYYVTKENVENHLQKLDAQLQ
ncbi:hypothetical protein [Selenomonas sp. AE3005]|uniref:hypothetical protein n=1 Tax=Selenomonas sp. AE3005 TaxID=1485543 RepID=UPI0025D1CDE2|nr:hypothetical protein [Selenomonas sp. AE3005]